MEFLKYLVEGQWNGSVFLCPGEIHSLDSGLSQRKTGLSIVPLFHLVLSSGNTFSLLATSEMDFKEYIFFGKLTVYGVCFLLLGGLQSEIILPFGKSKAF